MAKLSQLNRRFGGRLFECHEYLPDRDPLARLLFTLRACRSDVMILPRFRRDGRRSDSVEKCRLLALVHDDAELLRASVKDSAYQVGGVSEQRHAR